MEGKIQLRPASEPVTPQVLRSSADNVEQLYHTLDYIVAAARRAGLANNSITSAPLRSLEKNLAPVAALADWLDLASQPEALEKIFGTARQEKERGELIDLAEVE